MPTVQSASCLNTGSLVWCFGSPLYIWLTFGEEWNYVHCYSTINLKLCGDTSFQEHIENGKYVIVRKCTEYDDMIFMMIAVVKLSGYSWYLYFLECTFKTVFVFRVDALCLNCTLSLLDIIISLRSSDSFMRLFIARSRFISNWNLVSKLQRNLNQNKTIFIQENNLIRLKKWPWWSRKLATLQHIWLW